MESLELLSTEIETADAEVGTAASDLAAAQADRDKIADRIDALAAERRAIVQRRAAGDFRTTDGAALELLAADRDGLEAMLPEADAALQAAAARHREASAAAAARVAEYRRAEAHRALSAFDEHVGAVIKLVGETLRERHAAALALPVHERGVESMIKRATALQTLLLAEIRAARAAPPNVPLGQRPRLPVDSALVAELTKIQLNSGRLT